MDVRRRNIGASIKGTTGGGSSSSGTYTINLNGQWEKTTAVSNPDSSLYDGVYRSSSSYNVNDGVSIMYITIKNCSTFKMYIRSFAESSYDYVMVSQLDKSINGSTSYSDTTLVKAHTRGNQQPGTALSSYTLVEYTGISSGEHTITVVYRKDSSVNTDDDRGYVLIPKMDGNGSDSGGESGGSGDINNYLTIVALEDGLTASLSNNACEYCIDGDGNWLSLAAGATTQSINTGHTLSFRGNLPSSAGTGIGTFTISKKCNLEGNCMSMKFGDNAASNNSLSGYYTFSKLFYNCTNIASVSNNFLPATTLVDGCYRSMFANCSSLTTVPALPATTLADNCYESMFSGCSNLTTAPELPATTLADYCYRHMFNGCTSLTTALDLLATTLANNCYGNMFSGCKSLTTAPKLPATTLADACYNYMFSGCTSLTTAPELPATTLAVSCYSYMFSDCTSLTAAPILPATKLKSRCYSHMVSNTNVLPDCSNIDFSSTEVATSGGLAGLFANTKVTDADLFNILPIDSNGKYYLPSPTLSKNSYDSMFYNCTNLVTAPDIMASTATYYCCDSMFYNCINLLYPPKIPTRITSSAWSCFYGMFAGCKKLIATPELPSTTLSDACYASMFYGCIALTEAPELPATTLSENCYKQMFVNCDNITVAPTLPALNLKTRCYTKMFQNCNKLNYIKMLATDISASQCLEN